jgi:hypothetical protein
MSQVIERLRTVDRERLSRLAIRTEAPVLNVPYTPVNRPEMPVRSYHMPNGDPPALILWGSDESAT